MWNTASPHIRGRRTSPSGQETPFLFFLMPHINWTGSDHFRETQASDYLLIFNYIFFKSVCITDYKQCRNEERDLDKWVFTFRVCILVSRKRKLLEEMCHEFCDGAFILIVFCITRKKISQDVSRNCILGQFQNYFLYARCFS